MAGKEIEIKTKTNKSTKRQLRQVKLENELFLTRPNYFR